MNRSGKTLIRELGIGSERKCRTHSFSGLRPAAPTAPIIYFYSVVVPVSIPDSDTLLWVGDVLLIC